MEKLNGLLSKFKLSKIKVIAILVFIVMIFNLIAPTAYATSELINRNN